MEMSSADPSVYSAEPWRSQVSLLFAHKGTNFTERTECILVAELFTILFNFFNRMKIGNSKGNPIH
jgi:hypothetical protein